ncbi:tyrosine-type recombinase/integrase [Streptomyces sp. NPDC001348]
MEACGLTVAPSRLRVLAVKATTRREVRPVPPRRGIIRPTSTGLRLRLRLAPGQEPADVAASAERLRHAWGVHAVYVTIKPGVVELRLVGYDVLRRVRMPRKADGGLLKVPVALREDAMPFVRDYRTIPHQLTLGATLSGKSMYLRHLIAGLAPQSVALVGIDCKRGVELAPFAARAQTSRRPRCCAIGQCCRKRLSPLTLAYIHSVLKSALEHAVREEEIPRNVARNVRTGTPRPRRFNPLTADEVRQFLTTAQGHRLAALFELALRTGLRKGELLGLRWEDLDLDGGTASIRRTLQRTRSSGLATLPTKTISSERRIALPASCITSLRAHRQRQARERDRAGSEWQGSGHVFTRPDGRPIEPATLTRHFSTLLRDAHLRPIRFHDLRHSTATLLLEQGVELVVIKELLGHAHIGVTATVYAHVRLRLQRQAIDLLGHALGNLTDTTAEPGDDPPLRAAPVR